MQFNTSAPFGQASQPAFGQPPQQPPTANVFGASTSSPPGGKIIFGAAAGQQPAKVSEPAAQPGSVFGTLNRADQSNQGFGSAVTALNPFGNEAANAFGQGSLNSGNGPSMNGTGSGFGLSAGSGFGAYSGTGFGSQQPNKGFQGFGAAAGASSAPAASTPSGAFARLGPQAQPAAEAQNTFANGVGASPFGRLGQPAQTPTASSAAPFMSGGLATGNPQPPNAFGFRGGSPSGTNPFAVPASGTQIQPVDFGRAAKQKRVQQQASADQQQNQGNVQKLQQQLTRPKSPALVPRQLSNQVSAASQQQAPNDDLADPAALAARSQRFGPARPASGANHGRPSFSAPGTDADTTDDQQGSDRDDQPSLWQSKGFSQGIKTPTAAQPVTPGFLDAGLSRDDGEPSMSVEGFCKGMCPEYQLKLRVQHVTESSIEAVDPKGLGRGIEQLATKKWERNVNMTDNAALPNMFRTLPALKATEQHLLDYLDSNDPQLGLGRVSMYMWDRQRSIRQDMAWQKMEGPEVMRMYEEHAMSAIYMDAEMSHHGDPGNIDSTESYHPGLVVEQLNKTLISMTAMYEVALLQSRPGQNAAEFNTYAFIMLLVGTRQKEGPTAFFQRHILPYSPSPYVALALRLHRLVTNEVNPWAFFKLVDKASYRLGLWLQFLFSRMRYLYLTRIVSASGPKVNPDTWPVAELAHAMWFDSEDDTLEFLRKAGLEPDQSSTGSWQLVLHRTLKLDPQAASFRQRSARLCNLQHPTRSHNVREQGPATENAAKELVSGPTTMLQPRRPFVSVSQQSSQRSVPSTPTQHQHAQPGTSQAPQGTSFPAFSWSNAASPMQPASAPALSFTGIPQSALSPAPEPSSAQQPAVAQQLQLQQHQQEQQQKEQQQQAERRRLEQECLQRQQQQDAQRKREANDRARAEQARQQQQAEAERQQRQQEQQQQQQEAERQRQVKQRQEQQRQQQLQQEQQRQQQLQHQQQLQRQRQQEERQRQEALAAQRAKEQDRLKHEQQQQKQEQDKERKAHAHSEARIQKQVVQQWRRLTADRKAHYGQQAILSKLATSLQRLQPPAGSTSQVAPRQAISTADRPLPGPPSSKEGILQEALPLPALVSPALAAANEDQAYLRWKAVIHCLLGTAATAVHAPDYTAARWFCTQMMHRDGSRNHASSTDGLLKMAFTDLRASQLAKSHPVLSGIFTTVCDASSLTAADSSKNGQRQALQDSVAASSAIVLLLTRADKPAHTEASLGALLGSAPAALQVPLVLLTTAPDLHHGVQQWLHTLPGKLGRLWQHVSHVQSFCLAPRKPQQQAKGGRPSPPYSRAVLRDAVKWAAAHAPSQPALKAAPLEQVLAEQLQQQLEPLLAARQAAPSAWISTFNHMLHSTWQQINMAADLARGIGGWPAPEIARIDATLPQHWWQPSALSRLEGAFSSLCLPAMPASLAGSPAQAVPVYIQHFLGIRATSSASWQQMLAAAMHSRIRAIQQQHLPSVVLLTHTEPVPLLPQATSTHRRLHPPGLTPIADLDRSIAIPSVRQNQAASSVPGQLRQQPYVHQSMSTQPSLALSRATHNGNAPASDAATVHAGSLSTSPHHVSYADAVMKPAVSRFSKRKVPEVNMLQEPEGPVKRHQNGFDTFLSCLHEQHANLHMLLKDSNE